MDVVVRGITVHYEESGVGVPVFILHGWGESGRVRMPAFEPLFESRPGWRRIYPDVAAIVTTPGSTWLRSADDVLDVLLEFIDEVCNGERFVVAGASWGGYVAAAVVRARVERILGALFFAPAFEWGARQVALPSRQVISAEPGFEALLKPDEQVWLDAFVVRDRETLERVRRSPRGVPYDPRIFEVIGYRPFDLDPSDLPEPCRAPALFLMGRQDDSVGYRAAWPWLDRYPRATFAVLDRAGHLLDAEQPALWTALVTEWLDRVEEFAEQEAPG